MLLYCKRCLKSAGDAYNICLVKYGSINGSASDDIRNIHGADAPSFDVWRSCNKERIKAKRSSKRFNRKEDMRKKDHLSSRSLILLYPFKEKHKKGGLVSDRDIIIAGAIFSIMTQTL